MISRLEIKPTINSLHIILDAQNSVFSFEGKSFPEDSKHYFQPVLNWLEDFKTEEPKQIKIYCNLYYLSSSSTISFKQILSKFKDLETLGAAVTILWNYDDDDDDILKTGQDYMRLLKLPFEFFVNP